jgi:hypothetical protein
MRHALQFTIETDLTARTFMQSMKSIKQIFTKEFRNVCKI